MVEKARDFMQIGVKTIDRNDSVYDAIAVLAERRISGLPVMDGPTMVGIITEKDILRLIFHQEHLPGTVEKYMVRDVVAFDEGDDVAKIWACLVQQPYRRVPIMRDGRLAGIISRTDLIRARMDDFGFGSLREVSNQHARGPLVRDIMTAGLLTTTPGASVLEAAETLVTHGITGLPVVDDSMRLLGILSEKDVLRLFDTAPSQTWRVRDAMTPDVVSIDVDDDLFDVCKCLANNNFRRVPVLDRGRLVGIVSRADVILYLLKNRSILFRGGSPVAACMAG